MTAILIATRHEASELLRRLSPVKREGIYHYRGTIAGKAAALFLTRPGVYAPQQVRRFLMLYRLDAVVHSGSCASLTAALTHLQPVIISTVTTPGEKNRIIGQSGVSGVSLRHLVTTDNAKADLREQTGADVLDMETYTIAGIMAEPEFAALPFSVIRVVDDLPGEESYLAKDMALRQLMSGTARTRPSVREILRFGIWDYFVLKLRRRRVAREIFRQVKTALASIPER